MPKEPLIGQVAQGLDRVRELAQPFRAREAAICAPAIALLLATGGALGRPVESAVAAAAAFSVGFGAHRGFRGTRWAAMVGAALGMTAAAFLGSLLGGWPLAFLLLSGAVGAVVAWLALHDENIWWMALQCAIAFFVAGYFAGPPDEAVLRAGIVAIGGAAQILLVAVLRGFLFEGVALPAGQPAAPRPPLLHSHALRAAISVALATFVADRLGLANGYWAPMTALLILKPGLRDTQTRGFARLAGTAGGCAAASLFAIIALDRAFLLIVAALATSWLAYALQKAHYALFTAAVTATVVFFLALGHISEIASAEHRIAATLIGGGIALAVAYLGRRRPLSWPRSARDRLGP